jgi:hypothetical protein
MTAWPLPEIWSRWLEASGDLIFCTLGNCASVVVPSLIAARKAGSADVDVLDWIRTISPCSSSFVLKPAEMIVRLPGLADVGVVRLQVLRADHVSDRHRRDDEDEPADKCGLPMIRTPATDACRCVVRTGKR